MRSIISSYARRRMSPRSRGATWRKRPERLVGRGERRLAVGDGRVGDLDERLAGRRVLDRERAAAGRVAPLAADEELRGNRVEHGLLGARADRRHESSIPPAAKRARSGACGPALRAAYPGRGAPHPHAQPRRRVRPGRRATAAQGATSLDRHRPRLRPRRRPEPVRHARLRAARLDGRSHPRPLLHGHGARAAQHARRPCACCCRAGSRSTRSAAPRRSAASCSTRRRPTRSRAGATGSSCATSGGARPLHLARPDAAAPGLRRRA